MFFARSSRWMKHVRPATLLALMTLAGAMGCEPEPSTLLDGPGRDGPGGVPGTPGASSSGGPGAPGTPAAEMCKGRSREYQGFGGGNLTGDRADEYAGLNRGRMKPFSALDGEYRRVVGHTPKALAESGATFGASAPRWFVEPEASAVSVATAFNLAFEAGLALADTDPALASPPTDTSAANFCSNLLRKAWSRAPIAADVDACKAAALVDSVKDPDAKRRWAYAAATVLSSAEFVTY
jgi:hypothetical protein